MSGSADQLLVSGDLLRAQILTILDAWGMHKPSARMTAEVMVDTDLSGIDSHGVSMLMMYDALRRDGRLDLTAPPRVEREGGAFAVIAADHNLGHAAGALAMRTAIAKARAAGVGMCAVGGSNHFGALGYYARLASSEGMLAVVTTSTRTPTVAALGGTTPVLGTNPIAFSAPRPGEDPLVVDMSTSVVALNKVKAYALAGRRLPHGWVADRIGSSISDASTAHELLTSGGATLAALGGATVEGGGHKGFGLSIMVQVLSAALVGGALPGEEGAFDDLGHFFLAIDPAVVAPGQDVPGNVERILDAVQHEEPDVRIPGDPEREARGERGRLGIPLPAALVDHLQRICVDGGAAFLLSREPAL